MGRRSSHTADELRALILKAAQDIIAADGLAGLSAREIARRIGYSPGTLYNMYDNLDDLVLHVEARLIDDLDERLAAVAPNGAPGDGVLRLAQAYLAFTHEHPKLWNLLFEHHLPAQASVPAWYQQRLERLLARVEEALAPLMATRDASELKRAARVLWAGVHGITSLSTADKLSIITSETAQQLVANLVTTYLAGLGPPRRDGPVP